MAKAVNLNNEHRRTIIDNALAGRFADDAKKLNEDKTALIRDIYNHVITPKEREALLALGVKWTRKFYLPYIRVAVEGSKVYHLDVSPFDEHLNCDRYRNYTEEDKEFEGFLILPNEYPVPLRDKKLEERLAELSDRIAKTQTEYETLRTSLTALVNSVRTINGLARVWPEGSKFYNDIEDVSERLPATMISELNKALGLSAS